MTMLDAARSPNHFTRGRPVASLLRGLTLCVLLACGAAVAQTYPSKPIRIIVPFTPGGSTDIFARSLGQKLSQAWGQPVIVENRPGAGGSIGAELVAKAPPDGYTLLMGHIGTLAVNPTFYPKLPYAAVKSFAPVALIASVPNVLVVHPSLPANNVTELIALAKTKPGQLNYSSGGNGSAAHLAMEYFKLQTGTDIVHVPYKGTAPAVTDVIACQVSMTMTGAPAVMPHVQSGKLRALGVSSPQRLAAFPQLPPIAEVGVKGFDATQWYGVVAPAKTPADIVKKLNGEIRTIMQSPEMEERLRSEGAIATVSTPEEFGKMIASEIERWGKVIKSAGMKPD
jgi:tripartite-type tricarboxylate transporter receptor subunit TctC